MKTRHGYLTATVALVLGAGVVAGCGGSSSSNATAASNDSGLAEATAIVNTHKQVPQFVLNAPAYNARAAVTGKTIFSIPSISGIPFHEVGDAEMKRVAESLGAKWIEYANQGNPPEWAAGIEQAITRKVSLIDLGDLDPTLVIPQLQDAKKAGIPTVLTQIYNTGQPLPASVKGLITAQRTAPFDDAARVAAAWSVVQTHGHPNVLISTSEEQPPNPGIVQAFKSELQRLAPSAQTTTSNVPLTDWATKIQPETQSAFVKNPNINVAYGVYDAQDPYIGAGIRAAGKSGQIPIVSYNGSAETLKELQQGNLVKAVVGENLIWLAWANLDEQMRVLAGLPAVPDEKTPLRLFDKSNVNEAGTPPKDGEGYGTAYITGYENLWQAQIPPR